MELKYRLLKKTKSFNGHTLRQIVALRDFDDVKKGDKGGWIESEANLSHEGNCWVGDEAKVYGKARVYGDALAYGNAQVYGKALVSGEAQVYEDAQVYGDSQVYGNTEVYGYAHVYGDCKVYGDSQVCGNAQVYGNARVYGKAWVFGNAEVFGRAEVCGYVIVNSKAEICGDAVVEKMGDYMVFHNTWSSGRYFTYTKSNGMWKVGCFHGTGEELIKKAYADGEQKGDCYKIIVETMEKINSKLL